MSNILKSLFISLFPLFALFIFIKTLIQVFKGGIEPEHIGVLISSLAIVVLFIGLFVVRRARTRAQLPVYTSVITLGLFLSLAFIKNFELSNPYIYAPVILFLGWLAYLFWYSRFFDRPKTIIVGEKLPQIDMETVDKKPISSSAFIGSPSIYLFYRGNWCPLCMAQIKEIVSQYKELETRGVNTNFISPQPYKYSRSLAKKYGLNFNFLTDVDSKAARKLGIATKNGIPAGFQVLGYSSETVLPTVLITNAEGIIIYADLTDNYRIRPEPEEFIKILDQRKTTSG